MERFLPLSCRIHDLILNGSCMHLGYTLCQELGRSVQVSWVNLVPFSGMMLVRSYLEFLQIFLQDFYKLSCQDLTRCIDRVIRGFTVGRYQRDVVGKGVCMRVERLGGEEVWFLFDFCTADDQTVISFLKTCGLDK